jgi:hypothetical protein
MLNAQLRDRTQKEQLSLIDWQLRELIENEL